MKSVLIGFDRTEMHAANVRRIAAETGTGRSTVALVAGFDTLVSERVSLVNPSVS
jgi:hypothetical protein